MLLNHRKHFLKRFLISKHKLDFAHVPACLADSENVHFTKIRCLYQRIWRDLPTTCMYLVHNTAKSRYDFLSFLAFIMKVFDQFTLSSKYTEALKEIFYCMENKRR